MADGSTTGNGPEAPLNQGYGGIIWVTPESQAKNPCFVLVSSYVGPENVVNDQSQVSDEVVRKKNINLKQFAGGTVVPEDSQGFGAEHMYSFDYAYKLDGLREWLLRQVKGTYTR